MKKIKVITDTTSDISLEIANKYNIDLLGQNISFGDETFVETLELNAEDFYDKLVSFDGVPKTSQVNITKITEMFEKYYKDYKILYITISSKASGTNQTANLAKNMFLEEHDDADITIYDGYSLSLGYGRLALVAAQMANDGKDLDEIIKKIDYLKEKTKILFAVDTLDYLEKGGRISPTTKIIGNVLDIKPILTIANGLVESFDKVRGMKKIYSKFADIMKDEIDTEHTVYILHAVASDKVEKLKEKIDGIVDLNNVEVASIGGTVGTNTGPGAIGIIYITK